jgi:hypothetical protein
MTHRYRRRPAEGGRSDQRQIEFTARGSRLSGVGIKGKPVVFLGQIGVFDGFVGQVGDGASSQGRNFLD